MVLDSVRIAFSRTLKNQITVPQGPAREECCKYAPSLIIVKARFACLSTAVDHRNDVQVSLQAVVKVRRLHHLFFQS